MENEKTLFDTTDIDVNAFLEDQDDESNNDVILETVVGADKKYKTVNDLARAAIHKDLHIRKIEEENRALREVAAKAKGADEILKALQANQPNPNVQDRDNGFANSGADGGNNQGNRIPTEDEIANKVLAAMEAKTTKTKQDENFNYVKRELLKNLGAEYPNLIRQKAEELGLSDEDLNNLARKTPKAFFNLIGISPTQAVPNVSPNPVSRASEATAFNRQGEKTFSYYEKMRKSNPRQYYSPQIQNEILAQAFKLGDAFNR